MARPQTDIEAVRAELLEAAESLLKRQGGVKISMSDVAALCGMSQSNAYRFFPSKTALLAAVAERWFLEIERKLAGIALSDRDPETALRDFILAQLRLKRARFDSDPELFLAYLELGLRNVEIVTLHLNRIRRLLTEVVARLLADTAPSHIDIGRWVDLIEDMTTPFRDPRLISSQRDSCTDERADAVISFILSGLKSAEMPLDQLRNSV